MKKRSKPVKQTTIDIALNVIELFSAEKHEIGITEMSNLLDKKVSTLHRTVAILRNRGYMEQVDKRGKYRLGLKAFELGCVYQNQSNVMKEAASRMERLAEATHETINLAVLDQGMKEIAYIMKIDSPHVLKTDIQIGTKLFAHCTALGKVLLASLDPQMCESLFPPEAVLPTYTSKSLSTSAALHLELAKIRESGYALDDGEFRNEVVCIAMPYRDVSGKVVAAISVTGPAFRMTKTRVPEVTKSMFEVLRS